MLAARLNEWERQTKSALGNVRQGDYLSLTILLLLLIINRVPLIDNCAWLFRGNRRWLATREKNSPIWLSAIVTYFFKHENQKFFSLIKVVSTWWTYSICLKERYKKLFQWKISLEKNHVSVDFPLAVFISLHLDVSLQIRIIHLVGIVRLRTRRCLSFLSVYRALKSLEMFLNGRLLKGCSQFWREFFELFVPFRVQKNYIKHGRWDYNDIRFVKYNNSENIITQYFIRHTKFSHCKHYDGWWRNYRCLQRCRHWIWKRDIVWRN